MHFRRTLWIVFILLPLWINAQNWPQFRGTGAAGLSDGQQLPERWDIQSGTNMKWKAKIPGVAHSSPVFGETESSSTPR
jgi:outer membrane protein assembly factor BamB